MSELNSSHRYALYFAPASATPLEELGRNWLGRDSRTGDSIEPELPATISRDVWQTATASPRRYGFHATLKPPFYLAPGATIEALDEALQTFAQTCNPFPLPQLRVGRLGRFLALILSAPSSELHELAADCVRRFDSFRATPSEADLAKRMSSSQTPAERKNLLRWGYPYVFDTWKFHMTLTSSLQPELLDLFEQHLAKRCRLVCEQPLRCDSIWLFEEPATNAPFLQIKQYRLGQ